MGIMPNYTIDPRTGQPVMVNGPAQSYPVASNPYGGDPYAAVDPAAQVQADPAAQVQADPAAATAAQPDPWAAIAQAYGLGAPPAVGLPAVMPTPQLPAAPQVQPSLLDMSQIPQPIAQQMQIDPRISAMASGQGYSPDIIAKMRASAIQDASNAGLQQMSQTKRILGQNGIQGGAAAAAQGDVARQTGQAQNSALRNIDTNNAQVGNQNAQFGLGLETNIGQNNMQAANSLALANANTMFAGLKANQDTQNNANQMNTGMTFQRQNDQASMNYNNQKSQWDELNKRFGQSQNILGSWGAAA